MCNEVDRGSPVFITRNFLGQKVRFKSKFDLVFVEGCIFYRCRGFWFDKNGAFFELEEL